MPSRTLGQGFECASEAEQPFEFQVALDFVGLNLGWQERPSSSLSGRSEWADDITYMLESQSTIGPAASQFRATGFAPGPLQFFTPNEFFSVYEICGRKMTPGLSGVKPGVGGVREGQNKQRSARANGKPNTQRNMFFVIWRTAFQRVPHCAIHFSSRAWNWRWAPLERCEGHPAFRPSQQSLRRSPS